MFTLNFQSREPIYEQLCKNVVRMVALGVLKPEDKLPPVRTLAAEQGINPNTVSKAYQLLERDGVIYSVVGRGSFISADTTAVIQKKELAREELSASVKKALEAGLSKEEIVDITQSIFDEKQ